ncbi:MAG TPA: SGNH/GDSL hydrolase family protein [Labilithrix sp.]|nr:SGNH/GDSL hydrolase family protein [Labilithrix sp.]
MKSRLLLVSVAVLLVGFAGCSSSGDAGAVAAPGGDASPDAGTSPGDGGDLPDAEAGAPGVPKPTACPTAKYKTLVIVGDSISDVGGGGGGAGQQPFYRTLLVKNDDTLYPDWKGFDLATCWGLDPAVDVVKASQGGAVATVPAGNTPGDSHILLNQVTGLPATLAGPVLVVGTIGGNDVTSGLITVLTGTPAQLQTKIDSFAAGFGQAMAELTKVDRFGAGVKVSVLMTNVYDPSGGTGHFYYEPKKASCPGALGLWPDGQATAPQLAQWNAALTTEAAKYQGLRLVELRAPFEAHSVSTAADTNWFYQDCIHPSSAGHNAVRGVFWAGMVALP